MVGLINDPGTEAQSVQNLIQRGVDAIVMRPVSSDASVATIKSITEAGILMICYGNCAGELLELSLTNGAAPQGELMSV